MLFSYGANRLEVIHQDASWRLRRKTPNIQEFRHMKLSIKWKICLLGVAILGMMTAFIMVYIVPDIQNSLLEDKKAKLKEETQIAWSVLDYYHSQESAGALNQKDAQQAAMKAVGSLRYGQKMEDYFWINDFGPVMLMHPYKTDWIGANVNDYKDANGKPFFQEFVQICQMQKEGFSSYMWQYNGDAEKIVPKYSYIKSFEPWGWIVGTGVYIEDVNQAISETRNQLLIFCGVMAVLGLAFIYFVSQGISRNINRVNQAMKKIAAGDLTENIRIKSRDEVGVMAKSYDEMKRYLSSLVVQLKDNAQLLSRASEELNSAARQSGESTRQVATASQQMAKGAQEQSGNAQETAKSIAQLSLAVNQMNKGATEQSNGVREAGTSIVDISNTMSEVARNANLASQGSKQAADAARTGSDKTLLTLAGMNKIQTSANETAKKIDELGVRSLKIEKIVSVIEDIAAQTNMLALNAAIEAARAGEQGRGFAVVSDEVRKLAERTTAATREIADLISSVQKCVDEAIQVMAGGSVAVAEGCDLAKQSGQALEQILQSSHEVNLQIEQISAKTQQISTATGELVRVINSVGAITVENTAALGQISSNTTQVNKAIETVAGIAEENSASTEQVSASAQEMSAQVQEIVNSSEKLKGMAVSLEQSIAMFKVDSGAEEKPADIEKIKPKYEGDIR
jgi:methyl-accepting chemotaxis protein